jgi:hypothetical protein
MLVQHAYCASQYGAPTASHHVAMGSPDVPPPALELEVEVEAPPLELVEVELEEVSSSPAQHPSSTSSAIAYRSILPLSPIRRSGVLVFLDEFSLVRGVSPG